MLDALYDNPQPNAENAYANILGYLFAKAIEQTVNECKNDDGHYMSLTASYIPGDAFAGEISSTFSSEERVFLEKAMGIGKQFYNDLKTCVLTADVDEDQFAELFKQVAVVVQRLGQIYSACYRDR